MASESEPDNIADAQLEHVSTTPPTPSSHGAISPFDDLDAPEPASAAPPQRARFAGFALTLLGGLLSGLIGYGVGDLLGGSPVWAAIGALVGAVLGAIGVGIIANLTLQAMAEWDAVQHPEATASTETP